MELSYEDYRTLFEKAFLEKDLSEEEKTETIRKIEAMAGSNTSIADYVWLPLRFEGEKVSIDWLDEWRIEDYENETD